MLLTQLKPLTPHPPPPLPVKAPTYGHLKPNYNSHNGEAGKSFFLHTAEERQDCGGTKIRPHPSLEMSYSPPTNNQQVPPANACSRLSGIGRDGVIPSARQRVTLRTEITAPAFKNTLTRRRGGDFESPDPASCDPPPPLLPPHPVKKVTECERSSSGSPCDEPLST